MRKSQDRRCAPVRRIGKNSRARRRRYEKVSAGCSGIDGGWSLPGKELVAALRGGLLTHPEGVGDTASFLQTVVFSAQRARCNQLPVIVPERLKPLGQDGHPLHSLRTRPVTPATPNVTSNHPTPI
jgi:hypothetical protein